MTIRKMKIPRDPWNDPSKLRLRRGYGSEKERFLKRANLSDPERIERLRWRAIVRFERVVMKRWRDARDRIIEAGGAFVAKEDETPGGWVVLPRPETPEGYPSRLEVEDRYGEKCVTPSRDWWDHAPDLFKKPEAGSRKIKESALGQLAVAEFDEWWEKEELPRRKAEWAAELDRRKALVTPESLALGAEFEAAGDLCRRGRNRIGRINEFLLNSVNELDFIPERNYKSPIILNLNGRPYCFQAYHGGYLEAETGRWPEYGVDVQCVFDVPKFKFDESLIGKRREVIWTRFGEPSVVLGTSKEEQRTGRPNIWIYGATGVRFGRDSRSVEKILTAKEVSSLLKKAK